MILARLLGFLLLLTLLGGCTVGQVDTTTEGFPAVTGDNLNGDTFDLPQAFEEPYNLVFLAYTQEQQTDVNTWLEFADSLEQSYPVRFYELPTLTRTNGLFSGFIDSGMRSGIPDIETRSRTITLYIDRPKFLDALNIDSTDTIHTLLVRPNGEILFSGAGPFNEADAETITEILQEVTQ